MTSTDERATPDEKIVHHAKAWRRHERQKIGNPNDRELSRKEYDARQKLREAVDLAGDEHE